MRNRAGDHRSARQPTIDVGASAVIGPDVGQPLDDQVGARQVRDNPSKLREAFVLVDGWKWLATGAVFYDRDETMDEDSDSFEMIISIQQVGDGAPRVFRSVERHPDGSEKAMFRRGNDIRHFSRMELDQGSIVSMLDLPGDW